MAVIGQQTQTITLPDLTGDTYERSKGDLWELNFYDNHQFRNCSVNLKTLDHIAIVAGSTDGWGIHTIVTYVGATGGGFKEFTRDIGVDRWIDKDKDIKDRRFVLTKVN